MKKRTHEIPPLQSSGAGVDVPAEGIRRGDIATVVEWHPAPTSASEPGYSVEVFNALGDTLAVLTLPESSFEALRRDEVLRVRIC